MTSIISLEGVLNTGWTHCFTMILAIPNCIVSCDRRKRCMLIFLIQYKYALVLSYQRTQECFLLTRTDLKASSVQRFPSMFSSVKPAQIESRCLVSITHSIHDKILRVEPNTRRCAARTAASRHPPSPPKLTRPRQPKKNPTIPLPITGRWTTTDGPLNPVASRPPARVCPPPRDCDPNPAPPHPNY